MKIYKRLLALLLIALLSLSATGTAMADDKNNRSVEIPTLKVVQYENGLYFVRAEDKNGNVIYSKDRLAGTLEDIIEDSYNNIFRVAANSCTHIPCNHEIVTGGINHVINNDTGICSMITTDFYRCACCDELIGVVPGSTVVVGTHPAH